MWYSFQCFLSSHATDVVNPLPRMQSCWQNHTLFSPTKYLWNFLVKYMLDGKFFWSVTTASYCTALRSVLPASHPEGPANTVQLTKRDILNVMGSLVPYQTWLCPQLRAGCKTHVTILIGFHLFFRYSILGLTASHYSKLWVAWLCFDTEGMQRRGLIWKIHVWRDSILIEPLDILSWKEPTRIMETNSWVHPELCLRALSK